MLKLLRWIFPRKTEATPRRTIDDIPAEILQKNLFKRYFAAWNRPALELVRKQWKNLMPYDDSHLDIVRTCEGMSRHKHNMRLKHKRSGHTVDNCQRCRSVAFMRRVLTQCLEELVLKRNMGSHLKSLFWIVDLTDTRSSALYLDLSLASLIAANCPKLQQLRLRCHFSVETALSLLTNMKRINRLKSLDIEAISFESSFLPHSEIDIYALIL